jgi:hypothetical protein
MRSSHHYAKMIEVSIECCQKPISLTYNYKILILHMLFFYYEMQQKDDGAYMILMGRYKITKEL